MTFSDRSPVRTIDVEKNGFMGIGSVVLIVYNKWQRISILVPSGILYVPSLLWIFLFFEP